MMLRLRSVSTLAFITLSLGFFLTGCETLPHDSAEISAMRQAIHSEPPGDYFVGRRLYKDVYKMWGWVRKPGEQWRTAKLVMLNEQKKLAPDREAHALGSDNNYEYKLFGYFSGDTVYEPASNGFYPEFVLTGYELLNRRPARIYTNPREEQPEVRILTQPM